MRIGVTGGTGLIGTALCRRLVHEGNELVLFGRNRAAARDLVPAARFVEWDVQKQLVKRDLEGGFDAFVHLAGESIADGRWTPRQKRRIRDSRVLGTRNLVEGFGECGAAPGVLICSSAVGFYGDRGDEELDEESLPGSGFLSDLAVNWESEAKRISSLGSRLVLLRTGVVLSDLGGALRKMLLPFRLGLGGRLGDGRQFMSWIHLADQVDLIVFAIKNQSVEGALNTTAPNPARNLEFTRQLGRALGRPTWFPIPGFVLRLALGEMADALLLEGQFVLPRKAMSAGFTFRFPELTEALQDLLG